MIPEASSANWKNVAAVVIHSRWLKALLPDWIQAEAMIKGRVMEVWKKGGVKK